jgi:hypothetical protein
MELGCVQCRVLAVASLRVPLLSGSELGDGFVVGDRRQGLQAPITDGDLCMPPFLHVTCFCASVPFGFVVVSVCFPFW